MLSRVERVAFNEAAIRDVNERVMGPSDTATRQEYVYECFRSACRELVALDTVRATSIRFGVARGHEDATAEQVPSAPRATPSSRRRLTWPS